MKRLTRVVASVMLASIGLLLVAPGAASAHERRTVAGDYTFVVGFLKEPALQGDPNGIDLRVSTAGDQPVEGVEKTLKAEIVVGPNAMPIELRPRFRTPGAYNAEFIPTREGSYTFRFSGTVDGKPVNETFESGPGRFNDVQAATPLQFPDKVPSGAELQRAVAAADSRAATATTLGVSGLVAGVLGLLGAGWALMSRRQAAPTAAAALSTTRVAPAASQERL